MTELIHYDCDPGQDDAVALLYALAAPGLEIGSVSVVGGNARVENCAINALKILEYAGRSDIPVYVGAQQPLARELVTLPEVFGEDGMAGAEHWPAPACVPETKPAMVYLEELLSGSADPVTICATGPLTNLALVLRKRPELAGNIKRLVMMGGCPYPEPLRGLMGNFTPLGATGLAEYNFAVDPEAAAIVLGSDIRDMTMIGLNVTRAVLYDGDLDDRLRATGAQLARGAADILSVVGPEDREDYKHLHKRPGDPVRAMHDVLAFAFMDRPEFFTINNEYVKYYTDQPEGTPGLCHPVDGPGASVSRHKIGLAASVTPDAFRDRIVELLGRDKINERAA